MPLMDERRVPMSVIIEVITCVFVAFQMTVETPATVARLAEMRLVPIPPVCKEEPSVAVETIDWVGMKNVGLAWNDRLSSIKGL